MKAGKQCHILSRLCHSLKGKTKLLLNNYFMQCYFNYCNLILWHFYTTGDSLKIEKLQRKAIQYNFNDVHTEHFS